MDFGVISYRLLLALLLGGAIGYERGKKNHAAGLRTYMLVSLGSAMVMMIGQFSREVYQAGDPSRIAAQVVSGIGFLGAGTIILNGKNQIRGLTTAAGLWTVAIIGIGVGTGFYTGSIIATVLVLLVMTVMKQVDEYLSFKEKTVHIYFQFRSMSDFTAFRRSVIGKSVRTIDIEHISTSEYDNLIDIVAYVTFYPGHGSEEEIWELMYHQDTIVFSEIV